ncbi:tRNA (5-methylaminomethyl-2-thiouridine)(34)-methyltransferase MnmD [Vulcanococcus sp.]|uniref:tRNA (5-methylaminomethyl-2-thiouridine)(34)-methyltransferase MnmD n=1 Tax=Vulcanococcus sp. TaxID=2856995 RepID=UPI003C0CB850
MTSNASRLEPRQTEDGSFSLFSHQVGEGFHSGRGALAEARQKFVAPAELERWSPGDTVRVLDVCFGTGCNTAALLEAAQQRGLRLEWWGLELDPEPLDLALSHGGFQQQWQPTSLAILEQLRLKGAASQPTESSWSDAALGHGTLLWGDARQRLSELQERQRGCLDLVLMDAFSPSRSPQLWSVEFLSGLGSLLAPRGRLLTYCSAAAVRQALRLAGLEIASIAASSGLRKQKHDWSGGTAASPSSLDGAALLRALSPMEEEHLQTNAAEPYRDPTHRGERSVILRERQKAQQQAMQAGLVEATSSWRRRWGLGKESDNHQ